MEILFKMTYSPEKLKELSAIAEKHGTFDSVANYLGISPSKLLENRTKNIELDKILKKVVQKYKKEEKINKIYNEKGTTRKTPKDIIDKTMNGIADQTDTALANFRKLMEENKLRELAKRKKSGDFDDMIGF